MHMFSRITAACIVLCCPFAVLAQQSPIPKPGPEHTAFQKMDGTWDAAITLLGSVKGKGQVTFTMECGGMWREGNFQCDLGGLKLHTKVLDGYDPVKKKYVSVQVDSMSTVPTILEGTYDESMKVLTQTGESRDFKGAPEQVKHVTKHIDDDHVTVEVYRIFPDGKEKKMITIEYARQKESK